MRLVGPLTMLLSLCACSNEETAASGAPHKDAPGDTQSVAASSEGIDCTRASGQAEQAVCADKDLLALDRLAGPADEKLQSARRACGLDDDLKSCLAELYSLRIAERAEGGHSNSAIVGPVAFTCGAKPVAATFINAGAGYAVLETAGETAVLLRADAASGARYDGVSGAEGWSFWNKGPEATLVRAGREAGCDQVRVAPDAP